MVLRPVVLVLTVCIAAFSFFDQAAFAAPKAVIENTKIDLGVIRMGDVAESSITIRNEGDQPLEIMKIQISCASCLVLDSGGNDVIAPGASLVLPVKYNSEGRHGDLTATVAISTNDPVTPITIVDIDVTVKALIITKPDKVYEFGLAPRGYGLKKPLMISAGDKDTDIEILDLHMEQPTVTVEAEKSTVNNYCRLTLKFALDSATPLGMLKNTLIAKLRVGDEETELRMPVQGNVLGDVLILPPSIIDPIKAYKQGEYISEITVRSSINVQCPKVLGALAVGPLKAAIKPNPPENKYVVTVHVADNAPGGPRSGIVYVMTESKDEPVVKIPVYFKVARPLTVTPENLVFSISEGIPPAQRVELSSPDGKPFTLKDIRYENDLVTASIVTASPSGEMPAVIEVVPTGLVDPARAAAMVVVVTDCPGAEELLVPVLLRTQLKKEPTSTADFFAGN